MESPDLRNQLRQEVARGEALKDELSRSIAYHDARTEKVLPLIGEQTRLEIDLDLAKAQLKRFQNAVSHGSEMASLQQKMRDLQRRRAEIEGRPLINDDTVGDEVASKSPEHVQAEANLQSVEERLAAIRTLINKEDTRLKEEFGIKN